MLKLYKLIIWQQFKQVVLKTGVRWLLVELEKGRPRVRPRVRHGRGLGKVWSSTRISQGYDIMFMYLPMNY